VRVKPLEEDLRERAREVYEHSVSVVFDLMSELRMGRIPSSEPAKAALSEMTEVILRDKSALLALTMLKEYDDYTYVHSVNVGILCLAFAAHEGLTGEQMQAVGRCCTTWARSAQPRRSRSRSSRSRKSPS
jgi:HD-GYP domain-containing protein (c-di-GMP phosphodiesterase class II)